MEDEPGPGGAGGGGGGGGMPPPSAPGAEFIIGGGGGGRGIPPGEATVAAGALFSVEGTTGEAPNSELKAPWGIRGDGLAPLAFGEPVGKVCF
ncbi:hypothetical protein NQZ79_g8890 [Umbelopsis isabellina]|nr:hypothetical protein NQZ79_g8890 [Umbelopsis isabellina]